MKGEGNQQDYGMRVYDPRLGRFLSVDPLTQEYPWYTPYQFAGNTPIQAIDLDGEEPRKMVQRYLDNPALGYVRKDLVSGGFANNVHMRRIIGKDKKGNPLPDYKVFYMNLGKIFEDVVLRSMGKKESKQRFYPDPTDTKNYFYPDAIQDGSYVLLIKGFRGVTSIHKVFPNSVITEVKSTANVELEPEYNKTQLTKMIDYLATVRNADGEKATDYAAASLHIVTPAFTTIDPEIVKYATEKRVRLYLSWVDKDPNDPSKVRVSEKSYLLNDVKPNYPGAREVGDVTPTVDNNSTKSEKIDWNHQ